MMRNMFLNFFRRLFFGAPIDYRKIDRDLAMTASHGNINLRMGNVLFPDDKRQLMKKDKQLPPVSQQIEAHFDLSKMG